MKHEANFAWVVFAVIVLYFGVGTLYIRANTIQSSQNNEFQLIWGIVFTIAGIIMLLIGILCRFSNEALYYDGTRRTVDP